MTYDVNNAATQSCPQCAGFGYLHEDIHDQCLLCHGSGMWTNPDLLRELITAYSAGRTEAVRAHRGMNKHEMLLFIGNVAFLILTVIQLIMGEDARLTALALLIFVAANSVVRTLKTRK